MSVIELRQYTLKPRQRDAPIALFEREFVERQEDLGMTLCGTFRDADDPDRFVWLRGARRQLQFDNERSVAICPRGRTRP
jgi:hypothetical protein